MVDQGGDPGIHPALVVAGEDEHHREPEEAVLQPAQGQEQDYCARRGRHATRRGEDHRPAARRHPNGRDPHEPPARRRRRLAQRTDRPGGGDARPNPRPGGDGNPGEWEAGWVDEHAARETPLAASEEFENRRKALASALSALNDRERRIFEARRLAEEPITLSKL